MDILQAQGTLEHAPTVNICTPCKRTEIGTMKFIYLSYSSLINNSTYFIWSWLQPLFWWRLSFLVKTLSDATVLKSQTEHSGNGSSTRLACPCWSATDIPYKKSASPSCTCEWQRCFSSWFLVELRCPCGWRAVGLVWVLPHPFWEWFRAQEPCLW